MPPLVGVREDATDQRLRRMLDKHTH